MQVRVLSPEPENKMSREESRYCLECSQFLACLDIDDYTIVYNCRKKDLDFSKDCGHKHCRAVSKKINHDFCQLHRKYFDRMQKKEYKFGIAE